MISWIYKTVTYKESDIGNGLKKWEPDQNSLQQAFDEIIEFANQGDYKIVSMSQLSHQVGTDYANHAFTMSNTKVPVGYSHKIHESGVTIVVVLEKQMATQ